MVDTQDFMEIYQNGKIYGPYLSKKDNRLRIIYVENNTKTTISYPKYLIEISLNRYLTEEETVHHIDGNPLNNDLSNLTILNRTDHIKQDVKRRTGKTLICQWCNKEFFVEDSKLRQRERRDRNSNSFCSRQCSGKYGQSIQIGKPLFKKVKIERTYYKSIQKEISGMNGVNSTNP
jgi:hypothetical protein